MTVDPHPQQHESHSFDSIDTAVAAVRAGSMVVVLDDADRENEADLIMAAEFVTEDSAAFFLEHTSGLLCAALTSERQRQLDLPLMVRENTEQLGTAFLVSVDLAGATSTGISASDRAATIRALADPDTRPAQLNRPGHVLPLRAREGGVLERRGHTEAGVDLCALAGITPAALICELVTPNKRTMLSGHEAVEFARAHGFPVITIDDLVARRRETESVRRNATGALPLRGRRFDVASYSSASNPHVEHLAAVYGVIAEQTNVAVRVHSECLTGDVFGSERCDCGAQLSKSIDEIIDRGSGVVVYLRGHEGRGVGLAAKLRAYSLQDADGLDTVDANLAQGLPVDARDYADAAAILSDLAVRSINLLSNNPDKQRALAAAGIEIEERTSIVSGVNAHNVSYLRTKANRMGHHFGPSDLTAGEYIS